MRIGMVTTFYPPYSFGGDATYVRALARGLAERGHQVEVIHCADAFEMLNHGPPVGAEQPDPGVQVHRLRSGFGRVSPIVTQQTGLPGLKARALRRFFQTGRFDVVNFHNISLIGGPGVLSYAGDAVTLYTLHEHWLICPTHILWKNRQRACDGRTCLSCSLRSGIPPQAWRYGPLVRRALENVDCVISPSQFTADQHRAGGVTRPIEILPLFSVFESPSEPVAVAPNSFVFVGRVTPSKGLEAVLRVFAQLPGQQLAVIGDGDQQIALQNVYGGLANINFMGRLPQTELAQHYASATALIFPSLAPETFGLAVVEAASCGTPSLVRAGSGASPEIVEQSGGGLVYSSDEELGRLVQRLASRPIERQALGASARAAYEQHYTLAAHLNRYEALVETLRIRKGERRGASASPPIAPGASRNRTEDGICG